MIRVIIIIASLLFLVSCSSSVRFSSEAGALKHKNTFSNGKKTLDSDSNSNELKITRGFASYYSNEFKGKSTASGDIYAPERFTAAHLSLSFGTKLKVTNLKNNRRVIVEVNDRGPFITGRIIDLSWAAAEELDMINSGVAEVELEIIE